MPTDWDINWSAIDWVSAGAYVLAAVLAIIVIGGIITSSARALTKTAKNARGHGPVILAALVALLASAMSIQAQWEFLGHNLGIEHAWAKAAFVGVFDLAAIAAALLSREARVKRPGTFGADALIVWAVALLLGWLGSTEATTFEGQAARWAVPLVAALMWDRVIQRDVARAVALDRARMATVTGRITTIIVRISRAVGRSVMRTLARLGLVQPDQDIATIQQARWRRRFITAASRASAARRQHETTTTVRTARRRARTDERFASVVAAGQRLGAVTGPADLERLLWEAQVVLNAADALDQADAESPWRTAGRPNHEPIDLTSRPIDPEPNATDRPDVIDRSIDRIEPNTTDRPVASTARSIEPSSDRPTSNPEPTDRPKAIEGELIDRPRPTDRPTRRRSKEENERLIRAALVEILADADATDFPSHGAIATAAGVSKSTVSGYLGRVGLSGETTLTTAVIDGLPVHNIQEQP